MRRVLIALGLVILCCYVGLYNWAAVGDGASPLRLRTEQPTTATVTTSAPKIPMVKIKVETTKGPGEVLIAIHKDWAPLGADRFLSLVAEQYYDGNRFFRVLKSFVAQVGVNGDPHTTSSANKVRLQDDLVTHPNDRGTVSFAMSGKNTRSTQIFFNLVNNRYLDKEGFAPFGEVVQGMEHIDALFNGYGEGGRGDGSDGKGPNQGRISREGNPYLNKIFPKLSHIVHAEVVGY